MSEHAFSVAEAAIRNGATHEVPMSAADAVFRAMFGFYGNLWLSKFAIGQLDDDGSDAGVTSAKSIWAHGLREFDVGTVKVALRQCLEHHGRAVDGERGHQHAAAAGDRASRQCRRGDRH